MDGWVSGSNNVKSLKLDLSKIIQFCLKIYDLWIHSPPLDRCMGGWLGGCMGQWVGSCQIIKSQVNHHLI